MEMKTVNVKKIILQVTLSKKCLKPCSQLGGSLKLLTSGLEASHLHAATWYNAIGNPWK